jgi:hypothetical protein
MSIAHAVENHGVNVFKYDMLLYQNLYIILNLPAKLRKNEGNAKGKHVFIFYAEALRKIPKPWENCPKPWDKNAEAPQKSIVCPTGTD